MRDNAALNRFELEVEGRVAVAYYRPTPGRITVTHTEVPLALRGRGYGSSAEEHAESHPSTSLGEDARPSIRVML